MISLDSYEEEKTNRIRRVLGDFKKEMDKLTAPKLLKIWNVNLKDTWADYSPDVEAYERFLNLAKNLITRN